MPLIEFHNVSKIYKLGNAHTNLGEAISCLARRLVGHSKEGNNRNLWALKDVKFEVEQGETLAIIGPNGAGKTTILKLLSRVSLPTEGDIRVNGRLAALIELGAGFHPDLTGRENIYLYGSILGLSKKQIDNKFESIVNFSELEKFLDTPVKRYSSGMYVRLGFAVAVHVEPDVLLVDEVLAVGDMGFQRKCLDKIEEIRSQGTTVVFVSHYMRAIQSLCNRALWLDKGQVQEIGDTHSVVAAYSDAVNRSMACGQIKEYSDTERRGSGELQFRYIRVLNGSGATSNTFRMGEKLVIEMAYQAIQRIHSPSFDVAIYGDNGVRVCTATTRLSGCTPDYLDEKGVVQCIFNSIPFIAGGYSITVALFDKDDLTMYDQWYNAAGFVVESKLIGDTRWHLMQEEHGVVYLPPDWKYSSERLP